VPSRGRVGSLGRVALTDIKREYHSSLGNNCCKAIVLYHLIILYYYCMLLLP
jgi:hypothetical protein